MSLHRAPAFRLTFIASVLAAAALPAQALATFEGSIVANGVTQTFSPPANAVYGSNGPSNYSGYVDYGQSRVSASSDGRTGRTVVETTLVFRQTVVNPYATAQNVSFAFHIPRSRASLSFGQSWMPNLQTFTAAASLMGDITWGGVSVWNMNYGLTGSGSVAAGGSVSVNGPVRSASAGGFTVGSLQGDGPQVSTADVWVYDPVGEQYVPQSRTGLTGVSYVSSDDYQGFLSLGAIGANQTLELTYTLRATASFEGTYLFISDNECYGGYGGACAQAGGYDPFGIEFTPTMGVDGVDVMFSPAVVPEPATYGLMFGGLAAIGWALRRQRRGIGPSPART